MEKILIIDDSEDIRKQLKWGLIKDYSILLAGSRREALPLFRKNRPKVVTLDLGLPPHEDGTEEGFRCLQEILEAQPATKIILITGNDQRESALRAIEMGAYDFYQKPIELKELSVIIQRAFYLFNIEEENRNLHSEVQRKPSEFFKMIGQCPGMLEVFETARKVASSDVTVFIQGESGTGKELIARAIHSMSLRKEGPFIPINCGAIPENLLESELFGYEKGAFTGANTRVQGRFEYANKGTLFLDEIGEFPLNLQVKLLRFLQEKTIQRVGGREDIAVDTRIIAATNVDILKAIEENRFREDLYYRIGVITIKLPLLKERGSDIILLANFFLKRFSQEFNKKIKSFSSSALNLIQSYEWTGNVRELENRIQRAVIMADSSIIGPDTLGFGMDDELLQIPEIELMTLKEAKDKTEKDIIASAIERYHGNVLKAAEILGVSRPTLYELMKKHNINNVPEE